MTTRPHQIGKKRAKGNPVPQELTKALEEKPLEQSHTPVEAVPEESDIFDSANEHLAPSTPQTPTAAAAADMKPILEEPAAETAAETKIMGDAIDDVRTLAFGPLVCSCTVQCPRHSRRYPPLHKCRAAIWQCVSG